MNAYSVILFLDPDAKRFSVTARKPGSRLKEVVAAEAKKGFIDIAIARNSTKDIAEARAKELIKEWSDRGYERTSRGSL